MSGVPNATLAPGAPLPAASTVGPPVITTPGAPVPVAPPAVVVPAAPGAAVVVPGAVAPMGATVVQYGRDHMRITPTHMLAPVGSEVILKAGICDAEGYLVANQRVEWLLARDGAGQFVELGERESLDIFRWPWDTPRKIDNWYAIGSTAYAPLTLTRGNADPNDDVQIDRGDAWVTVSSATEGTSQVTAYTPNVDDWQLRRATATIYWVDAQWAFPPSACVESGRSHVLTTTVTRRTDGAPLAGWIVRYDVLGGRASLGYEGGSFVEATTDASGRASIEVSPTDVGGGTTNVNITVTRPALVGPAASPRLEIGRGLTTITWSGGGSIVPAAPAAPGTISLPPPPTATIGPPLASSATVPPSSPSSAPATSSPSSPYSGTPQPTLPNTTQPSDRYAAPRDEPPAGKPKLEIRLERTTPNQVAIGDFVSYNVVITNRGEGTARNISFRDRFDPGLTHPSAKPNEYAVEFKGIRDLAPGESISLPSPLTLQVIAGGEQCHEATVTADGAEAVSQRSCVTARQSAIEVSLNGPRSRVVGQPAEFNALVKNISDVAATNVVIVLRFDPALDPSATLERAHERLPDGGILFRVERLEPNERRPFPVVAQCMSSSTNACGKVVVTADGGVNQAAQACVEILPLLPGQSGAAAQSGLRLSFVVPNNPARSGEATIIYAYVDNGGQQTEQQVGLRVLLPPQFVPDQAQIKPQGEASISGQEVSFQPARELAPQGRREYAIPVRVSGSGTVQIRGAVSAASLVSPVVVDSLPIEILPAFN